MHTATAQSHAKLHSHQHPADHVLPRLPVRQRVLSVPKRLRYFLQRDGAALNAALRIFLQVVQQSLHGLNTHVHFHVCVVDGVLEAVSPCTYHRHTGRRCGRTVMRK